MEKNTKKNPLERDTRNTKNKKVNLKISFGIKQQLQ